MYSEILTYVPEDLSNRSFVHTYINGKRFRFYNGNQLGIACNPNRCTNVVDRKRELKRLERELNKKLSAGWLPGDDVIDKSISSQKAISILITRIADQGYSDDYQRDLIVTGEQFIQYLRSKDMCTVNLSQITSNSIEDFLSQFTSSGTYYMNKRRFLSANFSKMIKMGFTRTNPVKVTSKRKVKAILNESYKPEQLVPVLNYLRKTNRNLHLCAVLMYGTLLRPHKEIRRLRKKDFAPDYSYVILDGYRNKSGSIRKVPIAPYVKQTLLDMGIDSINDEENIFTRNPEPFNKYYFSLMWARAKKKMLKMNLVKAQQTLYSFRHSAAIDVFKRTQNLHTIQALFAHSNLSVSLTYLRSIGQDRMIDNECLPQLQG